MLTTLLETLSLEQKAELRGLGITSQLRGDWLHGRRLPTEPQAEILEIMGKLPPGALREWIAMQKANPAQAAWLQRAKGKLQRGVTVLGVAVMLCCGISASAPHAWAHGLRNRR